MSSTLSAIEINSAERSPMMRSLLRLGTLIALGSFMIVALLPLEEEVRTSGIGSHGILLKAGLLLCLAIIATVGFYFLLTKSESFLDASSVAQGQFLDSIAPKYVNVAILVSAALSLFLELAIIRWQSSIFEFFCFL